MSKLISTKIKQIINFFIHILKNTRGVRILQCKVDEKGNKIITFQALGSFHSDEIDYDEYKKGLIYDTEPSDVELVSVFFHTNNFEKYKIYCFDPINNSISICDYYQNNIVKITSDNWTESIKYLKHMKNSEAQHIVNTIVNFEINNYINSQEELLFNNIEENIDKNYLELDELENSNVIQFNDYSDLKRVK